MTRTATPTVGARRTVPSMIIIMLPVGDIVVAMAVILVLAVLLRLVAGWLLGAGAVRGQADQVDLTAALGPGIGV